MHFIAWSTEGFTRLPQTEHWQWETLKCTKSATNTLHGHTEWAQLLFKNSSYSTRHLSLQLGSMQSLNGEKGFLVLKDHSKLIAQFKNSNVSFFYCLRRVVSNQIYLQNSYIFRLPAQRRNLSLCLCWALNVTLEMRCWLDMKKKKKNKREVSKCSLFCINTENG